jgi:hypothetical protein
MDQLRFAQVQIGQLQSGPQGQSWQIMGVYSPWTPIGVCIGKRTTLGFLTLKGRFKERPKLGY